MSRTGNVLRFNANPKLSFGNTNSCYFLISFPYGENGVLCPDLNIFRFLPFACVCAHDMNQKNIQTIPKEQYFLIIKYVFNRKSLACCQIAYWFKSM